MYAALPPGACALAASDFGGLDIIFNNAGHGGHPGGVEAMTVEGWDATFAVLVRAVVLGMKHALPLMQARGGGSIINTASIAGLEAGWGPLAYSTSKAAVIHLSRCAAAELSPQKIRVNAICPGYIDTPWFDKVPGSSNREKLRDSSAAATPLKAASTAEDVADATLFLASPHSRHVTGETLLVDAGLHLGFASLGMN